VYAGEMLGAIDKEHVVMAIFFQMMTSSGVLLLFREYRIVGVLLGNLQLGQNKL
jgi:hypothetical protein